MQQVSDMHSKFALWPLVIAITIVIMAALRRKRGHYILPCGYFYLLSFFLSFAIISAVADWMSAILVHMVWP